MDCVAPVGRGEGADFECSCRSSRVAARTGGSFSLLLSEAVVLNPKLLFGCVGVVVKRKFLWCQLKSMACERGSTPQDLTYRSHVTYPHRSL